MLIEVNEFAIACHDGSRNVVAF